jgi:hypothetical protein
VIINPFFDLFEPFVFFADKIIMAEVDKINYRFGCNESMGIKNGDFVIPPLSMTNPLVL